MLGRRLGQVAVVLAMVALVCAAFAQPASAVLKGTFKVAGKTLEAGKSKTVARWKDLADYKFRDIGGGGFLQIDCEELEFKESTIFGEAPAVSFFTLKFAFCKGTFQGAECLSIGVVSEPLRGEQVEILAPAGLKGNAGTLFRPTKGTTLFKFDMVCGGQHKTPTITGSVVSEYFGTEVEAVVKTFAFPSSVVTKVQTAGEGEVVPAATMPGFGPVWVQGATETKLIGEEKWGPF
jgi:hypothetical protein